MFISVGASLPASDLERAKSWYAEKLGLKPAREEPEGVWYEIGDTAFLVYQSEFAGTNKATAAGLQAEDFDSAIATLRDRGVTFEEFDLGDGFETVDGIATAPDGTKGAWVKDSEGNILAIIAM